ncbi:MAG: metallophosphoesterase [Cyclobacteriaceae bacterium]
MNRFQVFVIILSALLFLIINPYVYFSLKGLFSSKKILAYLTLFTIVWELVTILVMYIRFSSGHAVSSDLVSNILMGGLFASVISKFILIVFLLLGDGFFVVEKLITDDYSSSKRDFIKKVGLFTAAIPFTGLVYGFVKGRYQFTVHKHTLSYSDLPTSFKGFKIAQISDVHSGSWDSLEKMKEGLTLLMKQKPDVIFLTGDIVNNLAEEAEPYIDIFKELSAPYGKFAVMGNHDYGMHANWGSVADKLKNVADVRKQYQRMGFRLLDNEHEIITINDEKINVVGVENWGKAPFPQLGDLDKALKGIDSDSFKVLLSHDPDHWDEKTRKHDTQFHLTLSGHTHGCQMGVEIPGFRFSPVQYKYKRWAGLYKEGNERLYVNRGFGVIGYPGRIGVWPEVTIIELQKES